MLFSDVEQSTLLLTRLGQAYAQALDGCRTAQRAAWAAFGGVEMGTEGDSFFVVFSTAEDAVRGSSGGAASLWPPRMAEWRTGPGADGHPRRQPADP